MPQPQALSKAQFADFWPRRPLMLVADLSRYQRAVWQKTIPAAIRGGVNVVRFRGRWDAIIHAPGALTIVDGVSHFPESEMKEIGSAFGVSVHSVDAAVRAQGLGAPYLLFGSVFKTESHPEREAAGLDALNAVCQAVRIPVVAIGGINAGNAKICIEAGASGVAVIGAIAGSADPELAAIELREAIND